MQDAWASGGRSRYSYSTYLNVQGPQGDLGAEQRYHYVRVGYPELYVSPDGLHQAPYTNWNSAATNITTALGASAAGTTILVSNGHYRLTSPITVSQAVRLQGIGAPEQVVIDGQGLVRCLTVQQPGVVIENLTLANGAYNSWPGGAGVYFQNGGVMRNCMVVSNRSVSGGAGGVYAQGPEPLVLTDCCIEHNEGYDSGGGVSAGTELYMTSCTVRANSAYRRGGVYAQYGGAVINSTISSNQSLDYGGGGIDAAGTSFVMTGCILQSNRTVSSGGGAYVWSPAGTIEDCLFASNEGVGGGGLYAGYDVFVDRCRFVANRAATAGGGAHISDGPVRNSVFAWNESGTDGGGLYAYSNTEVDNTTFAWNRAAERGGGLWGVFSFTARNNLAVENHALLYPDIGHQYINQVTYMHCGTTRDLLPGPGNFLAEHVFADPGAGDFSLLYGAAGIDAGTNIAWMAGAQDLYGGSRVAGAAPDIGAAEFDGVPVGVTFSAGPTAGYAPLTVVFTAEVYRAVAAPVTVGWDFEADGAIDLEGAELTVVTQVYAAAGSYDVRVTVEDALARSAFGTRPDYIQAWAPPLTHYVSSSGSDTPPYTGWATAAHDIQAAVDVAADGGMILLDEETHATTGTVTLVKAVRLSGRTGDPSNVVIDGGGTHRVITLENAFARVENLTVQNGYVDRYGAGIYAPVGGTISNCTVRDNATIYSGFDYGGSGVYLGYGTMDACLVEGNSTGPYYQGGAGARLMNDALARNCTFTNNATTTGGRGGGLALYASRAESCLIVSNAAGYGGVFLSDGSVLTSSRVERNAGYYGGGLALWGNDLVSHCAVVSNTAQTGGGVYLADTATLRNCLVAGNAATYHDGGINLAAGILESSTVVGNVCTSHVGGVGSESGVPTILNSIMYLNDGAPGLDDHGYLNASLGNLDYVCTSLEPTGLGPGVVIITNEPAFIDAPGGDFRIDGDSPCFNAGLNQAWMSTAFDLDGSNRIAYGQVDLGAYESSAPTLVCDFTATPLDGRRPMVVDFAASFAGVSDTNTIHFSWDFDNDGTPDQAGWGLTAPTHAYFAGLYHSVSLTVSNQAGLTDTETKIDYIRSRPPAVTHYVSPDGAHTPPFTTWADAATNLADAVEAAGDFNLVVVSNGHYLISSSIVLSNETEVIGLGGASNTIVDAQGSGRVFHLVHSNAVLRGLTVQNGDAGSEPGGGVLIDDGGFVEACIVRDNDAAHGAGIDCTNAGVIAHCVIESNVTYGAGGYGGGLHLGGDTVASNCVIRGNSGGYGGGFMGLPGALVRNCLVYDNFGGSGGGGYVREYVQVENCTVAANHAAFIGGLDSFPIWTGSGWIGHAVLRNVILYANTATVDNGDQDLGGYLDDTMFENACVGSLPMGGLSGAGLVFGDPNFADAANHDLHLMPGSVCIDQGANQAWMSGALDVEGNPRIRGAAVDLGGLEFDPDPPQCWFSRSGTGGLTPYTVDLDAYVSGADLAGLTYYWDLDGDGTADQVGPALDMLTVVYDQPGDFSPELVVSNTAGAHASWTYNTPIHVAPGVVYVATNGTSVSPYGSWSTAATNVSDAVDLAEDGTTVLIDDGTYVLTGEVMVDEGMAVRSVNGRDHTILDANLQTNRCMRITDRDAVVEGLSFTRGLLVTEDGGGVHITHGTLRDCRIHDCTAFRGGGLFVDGVYAVVERCLIDHNLAYCYENRSGGGAGGVLMYDGLLDRCVVRDNESVQELEQNARAGGLQMGGGMPLVRNCLVTSNTCDINGGGVFLGRGVVENCTIVANTQDNPTLHGGHELYWHQDTLTEVRNSIIRHVPSGETNVAYVIFLNTTTGMTNFYFTNCCADTSLILPGSGNMVADPKFELASNAWYRLAPDSPCIDAGLNPGASDRDLDGFLRPLDGDADGTNTVDIGASEFTPASLDSDEDGATDRIEIDELGSDLLEPDTDGDGSDDGDEYIAGTDATDENDRFGVDAAGTFTGVPGEFIFSWYSAPGRLYTVKVTEDLLAGWGPLAGYVDLSGTGGLMSCTNNPATAGPFFYRVEIRMP